MAVVNYASVYEYIRTYLGDYDAADPDYESTWIDAAITWVLLFDAITGYSKVAGANQIDPDITADNDKTKELALKASRVLLKPQASFSYRTAVMQVQLEESAKEVLLSDIDEELEKLKTGSGSPSAQDSSIKQYGDYSDRVKELTDDFT